MFVVSNYSKANSQLKLSGPVLSEVKRKNVLQNDIRFVFVLVNNILLIEEKFCIIALQSAIKCRQPQIVKNDKSHISRTTLEVGKN